MQNVPGARWLGLDRLRRRQNLGDFTSSAALWLALLFLSFATVTSPATPNTFLHARGQDILNARGEKILLRGVGLGNWMLPEGYMWKFGEQGDRPRKIEKIVSDLIGPERSQRFWTEFRKSYITEADIARIAQLGFNSVRPALNSRLFLTETDPPVHVEEGFLLLDNLVRWCKANEIYVIIDLHGAPGGQTGQNIDDSPNDQPGLFMEKKYQDQTVELWRTIARRYKDEPTVAGYDLLNEPLPERTGAAKTYKAALEPFYKRITAAIREIDSKHMIILEGADWANDWSVFSKPFDKNLVYQFHYYCWDNPPVVKGIQKYLDFQKGHNVPVWVGETGEKDSTIYWATTEYFEANNIGWSFWPWKKMDTGNTPCSIKPPKNWDAVAAYSRGGTKPVPAVAQQAFDELIFNIRLENCTFFPDVVNAILRQAPVRIEAENFGRGGFGISYFVTNRTQLAQFYRLSEPVTINSIKTPRRQSDQSITLNATEWTAYSVFSAEPREYSITARVKSASGKSEAQLRIGDQIRKVAIPTNSWSEIKLLPISLKKGLNGLQWRVESGIVDLDWLNLSPVGTTETSAAMPGATSSR